MPTKHGYTLDDLPRYSPWPARLLGIEPWGQRQKTATEVTREYEGEKWGPLLSELEAKGRTATVEEVDRWVYRGVEASLCWTEGELRLLGPHEAHRIQLELAAEVLQRWLPATGLVELGAGYGSVLLSLAERPPFREVPLIAGEYTPSGVKLMRVLADAQGVALHAGPCDFRNLDLTALQVPPGALLFTSFATHYVPTLSADFVTALCACRPRAVVQIEPCYEHCDPFSATGLMRRRYIELNDYNTNLLTLLRQQQARGVIQIEEEHPAVFGSNPLLPASVLVWVPRAAARGPQADAQTRDPANELFARWTRDKQLG